MPRYRLRTLGGLALARTDEESGEEALSNSKALLILAFLATRPDHTARRIDVAELLWHDSDRQRALRALRQALFFLSGHADDVLRRGEDTLTLDPDVVCVDLWDFDRAVAAGDHATAIALARGPFAAGQARKVGAEAEQWIEGVNARIAVGLDVAYPHEIERASAAGDAARATELARAFAALNPLNEERQVRLARTLQAIGDDVGAVQTLEAYRRLSEQALGEPLSAEAETRLQAMREDLRRRTSGTTGPRAPTTEAVATPRRVFTVAGYPVGRRTLAIAAAAIFFLLVAALALPRRAPPAPDPFAGIDTRLLAVAQTGNTLRVLDLAVQGTAVAVTERRDLQPTDLPGPGGSVVATTFRAPQGWDLAVRPSDDSVRVLTHTPGDEFPVEWSPDGRYLVFVHRRLLADGRTQSYALGVYDLAADTTWALAPSLESTEFPAAAWSPDGTPIAFTADVRGAPDVFLVNFDGTNLRNLTRNPAWDGDPAWTPDGSRIAFVSRRGGSTDVFSVRPDRSDLQRLTRSDEEKRRPLWLSATTLALLIGEDDDRELDVLEAFTGQRRTLDTPSGLVALVSQPDRPLPWLDRLVITPRITRASPGQYITLTADAVGSTGEPFRTVLPITWSVDDREVARLEKAGHVRVIGAGSARVVASVAGWREDTLALFSVPLAERPVQATFSEDWTGGLDEDRWRTFGDPPPVTRSSGGPDGSGVFANHGDAFFASGAVTRDAFPLRDGLGVEVEGRMPFSGKLHQEFALALFDREYPDSTLASGTAPALAEFRVRGPSGADAAQAWIATPDQRVDLPPPPRPGAWHVYTLQVLPEGLLELIVDGRLLWRSATPLAPRAQSVRVGLGYQSFETDIQHARLRVYAPPRYYLPEVTLEEPTPEPE